MLVEMAVADAYGIGFEFVDHTADRPNDLTTFHQHPKYADMKPGCYTDDTQRAIANAKVVLSGNYFNASLYTESYVDTFRADPRPGYSRRFQQFIEEAVAAGSAHTCRSEVYFRQNVKRTASSNGAIMGAAVLGYIENPSDCAFAAAIQALTTHSPDTIIYAQAVALSANYYLYDRKGQFGREGWKLDDFLAEYVTGDLPSWSGDPDVRTDMSAKNTWKAIRRCLELTDLRSILHHAVEIGGDTDSVAASAVAIASANPDVRDNLPMALTSKLEDGPFGLRYLSELEDRLARFRDQQARWREEGR